MVIAHPVGDGSSIEIIGDLGSSSALVDCGGNDRAIEVLSHASVRGMNEFVLTHPHLDHYSGVTLFPTGKKLSRDVDHVFIPALPLLGSEEITFKFALALFALNFMLGSKTGVAEKDLLDQFVHMNPSGANPKVSLLALGDSFNLSGRQLEVLWPPLRASGILVQSVEEAIGAFENALQVDDMARKARDKVIVAAEEAAKGAASRAGHGDSGAEQPQLSDPVPEDEAKNICEEPGLGFPVDVSDEVKAANEKIRSVANRLSLAFRSLGCFLHLGDLESYELSAVVNNLGKSTHYCSIVAAHHGTHFSARMSALTARTLLVSNGPKRHVIDPGYLKIANMIQETYRQGHCFAFF